MRLIIPCFISLLICTTCKSDRESLFLRLPSSKTGIDFRNDITENDSLNVLQFEYIYNGGGLGVGDLNNDGLSDIFFAGNMVSSQLYLNQGQMRFRKVTQIAGTGTQLWCTGVAIADINADGRQDIYVTTISPNMHDFALNLLFLNQGNDAEGIPKFREVAAQVGLADNSYSTQAAFLDYDNDGDLDLFLLNNALETYNRNELAGQKHNGTGRSLDRLYRNDSIGADGLPHFSDVSSIAGILSEGWGLGVAVSDINLDGRPDIYAANDFQSNDQLYINQGDGKFKNEIDSYFKHTCHNSMGMDIADLNNDQLPDIGVVDMLPNDNLRQKTMFPGVPYNRFSRALGLGYQPQYVRNVLQINNGNQTFSDLGYLAGIHATDWSWSILMADFDNDGLRDIFITNGYRKDITDLDFVAYNKEKKLFNTDKSLNNELKAQLAGMKGVKKPNFAFQNKGDLHFQDVSESWGLADPSYANGTAYADFDNDGDLDLVINTINDEALIYQNQWAEQATATSSNFLRIRFIDAGTQGYGAKVWAYSAGKVWYAEYFPQKGYQSTQEAFVHLGLGQCPRLDSLRVTWSNGYTQVLSGITTNQVLGLEAVNANLCRPLPTVEQTWAPEAYFHDVSARFNFTHTERDFVDFNYQLLLPRKYSEPGPQLTTGDVDGNGLIDVMMGGPAGESAVLFLQQRDGSFQKRTLPKKDAEDAGILLFDADGDLDLDLYCAAGSSEFLRRPGIYQDRLYLNDGKGYFSLDSTAPAPENASASSVVAADYDRDGDVDLFVGGRMTPAEYPVLPSSYLLQNDGQGNFTNATPESLARIGMVTASQWSDIDGDGWQDLVLVGEFMPITIFRNIKGKLTRWDLPALEKTSGWYYSLAIADLNQDNRPDIIAGNLGLNSRYRASPEQPVRIYAKDYDNNGSIDPLLCLFIQGKEYITHPRDNLTEQIPSIKKVLNQYAIYGTKSYLDIFPEKVREGILLLEAQEMRSLTLLNLGEGKWSLNPLPIPAQVAPIQSIIPIDVNHDGHLDLLTAGNDYSTEPLTGRYDAGIGTILLGNSTGQFAHWPNRVHGFIADGDVRAVVTLPTIGNDRLFVVAQRNGPIRAYLQVHPDPSVSKDIPH